MKMKSLAAVPAAIATMLVLCDFIHHGEAVRNTSIITRDLESSEAGRSFLSGGIFNRQSTYGDGAFGGSYDPSSLVSIEY